MPPRVAPRGRGRGRGRSTEGPRTRSRREPTPPVTEGGPRTRSRREPTPPTNDGGASTNLTAEQIQDLIAQHVAAAIAQQNAVGGGGEGPSQQGNATGEGSRSRGNSEGSYKSFMMCKPEPYHGNEGTIKTLHWIDEIEAILDISKVAEADKVRFVSHCFKAEALEWWNTMIQTLGRNEANAIPWAEFVKAIIDKYCPQNEMEKLQTEFLSLTMVGKEVQKYTQRFNALARLLPNLVTPESQKVNRYIWGLDDRVRGLVKASRPTTMKSAIELAAIVTDDRIRAGDFETEKRGVKRRSEEGKRHVVYTARGQPSRRTDDRRNDNRRKTGTQGSRSKS